VFNVHTIGADNLFSPLELAKMALYIMQTIIADSVMVSSTSRIVLPPEKGSSFGDVMCFTTKAS
jgi:hypothetical protein